MKCILVANLNKYSLSQCVKAYRIVNIANLWNNVYWSDGGLLSNNEQKFSSTETSIDSDDECNNQED